MRDEQSQFLEKMENLQFQLQTLQEKLEYTQERIVIEQ